MNTFTVQGKTMLQKKLGVISVALALGGILLYAVLSLAAHYLNLNISGLNWFILTMIEIAAIVSGSYAFRDLWGKCGVLVAIAVLCLLFLMTA